MKAFPGSLWSLSYSSPLIRSSLSTRTERKSSQSSVAWWADEIVLLGGSAVSSHLKKWPVILIITVFLNSKIESDRCALNLTGRHTETRSTRHLSARLKDAVGNSRSKSVMPTCCGRMKAWPAMKAMTERDDFVGERDKQKVSFYRGYYFGACFSKHILIHWYAAQWRLFPKLLMTQWIMDSNSSIKHSAGFGPGAFQRMQVWANVTQSKLIHRNSRDPPVNMVLI